MQILIDYFVFTSKIHSLNQIIELFGLQDVEFINIRSYYGYPHCLYYQGIKIHHGREEDICFDLSGAGCRTLEQLHNCNFDWYGFLDCFRDDILSGDVHFARLDIACDDFEGILKYDTLVKYIKERKYVCRSKLKPYWTDGREQAIYFGSSKSDRRLRIYNKALEQGIEDAKWIRCEFQLRNDNALSFILNLYECNGNIGQCYFGVLVDYLKFVNQKVDESLNRHYDRLMIVRWWSKFTENAKALKQLYLQGKKYDLLSIETYVEKYCSSSLKSLLIAYDGDLSKIMDFMDKAELNKRQKMALSDIGVL